MGLAFVLAFLLVSLEKVEAQTTIASESFENSLTLFTQSGGTAIYKTGNSGTSDRPASVSYTTQGTGTYSWGISNYSSGAQLTSSAINTSNYSGVYLTFRLAAFSNGVTTNGLDGNDSVAVYISPDNGTTYYSTIHVSGYASANAYWGFSGTGAGTATASTPYDGNYSPLLFLPAAGGSRTTDGYSTVTITNLPSVTNLKVRIKVYNNSTSELWLLDDFQVIGTILTPCASPLNAGTATITSTTGCASTNFTLNATGLTTATGLSYQWQSSPTGLAGSWSNIGSVNATSLTTSTSSTTYYQLVTTCSNDNSTSTTNTVSYTVTGNPCTCATYSTNYASSTVAEDITNVTVGSMNNPSVCGATAPGAGSIANRYSNYTASVTGPTVAQNASVSFSLTQDCSNSYANGFQIYVDWNQNGSFSDAGEQAYSQTTSVTGNNTVTGSFTVPATATIGTTRMRIVNAEKTFPTVTNYAETAFNYGETEDYCFTVISGLNCSGAPTPGNTLASATSILAGNTTNLSLQNATTGLGVTYQWYSNTTNSTSGGTLILNATSSTYTATPNALSTWYYCLVTCSSSSTYSNPIEITVNYCTTTMYSVGCSGNIDINSISLSNLNQTNTGCNGGTGIADYTAITVNFSQNSSYNYTITSNFSTGESIGIWIDFNDNGSFGDAGEFVSSAQVGTGTTITGTVTIPSGATLGNHRMRVRLVHSNTQSLSTSCIYYINGETHDYTANIGNTCAPTTQATIGSYTNPSPTSVSVNWVRGNGTGGVIVVARLTSTAEVTPSSGTTYSANTTFGSGTGSAITGTGNYVVYNGTGTSVNVTGLSSATGYTFSVYEYSTASNCYLIPGSSSAFTSPCSPNAGIASITSSSGCISTSFTVSATGLTSGSGSTYQWQSSPTGLSGSWTNITGATSATYSTSVTSTTYYQLLTTCPNGGGTNVTNTVSFSVASISCTCFTYPSVYANFVADNDLTSVTVGSMTNSSSCGDLAPGSGSIAYRYSNYAGNVTGPSAAQGASVSFSLTENLCSGGSNNQNYFLIYIDWNQNGSFAEANEKIYSQIDLVANGTLPSPDVVSTQTISGFFTVPTTALTGVTRMRVINTNGAFPSSNYAQTDSYSWGETEDYCFTVTSATGPVCPNAASIAPSSVQTICQNGTTTQLIASYTTGGVTGTPTALYQWYYNTTNSNTVSGATLIAGQTTNTFTPPSTTIGTRYYFCVVYATDNGCAQTNATQSLASNAVAVTIVDPSTAIASITQGATASFCSGSSVTLNANTGSGLTYQWQLNGSPIGGANSSTYAANAAGTYSVVVTGSSGCSATSSGTVVSSNPAPTISAQTSTICSGQAFTVSPASAPSGTTYTWSAPTLSPSNSITGSSAQASPQPSISQTLTNTTTASATATYTVTPTSGICVGSTFTVTVTVDPPLNYGTAASVAFSGSVTHMVISQIYGAGGNDYRYDYVELFNPTNASINIGGYSLQYQTQGSGTWNVAATIPTNTIVPAGGYFLIHLSDQTTGASITADYTGTTVVNANQGKMALSNASATLTSCASATIVDKVAWGTTSVVCNETANSTAPGNTSAIFRKLNGCQDNDNNSGDFALATPNPRNSASPENLCTVAAPTSFCGSATPGSMSVTAVSGGTSYTYQWYSQAGSITCPTGSSTVGWTSLGSVNGANTATYTPTSAINTTTTFACMVTINGSSCGSSQWSTSCITITINPTPSISNYSISNCGGISFDATPQNGTNGTVPSNTTYTWAAPSVAGITGASAGTSATSITGNLVNTTDLPINVDYTITPTVSTCSGTPFTVTITVNPSPIVNQISTSICSGNAITVTPTNLTNGVIPTGTVFTWNAPNQSGVTGGVSGTGSSIPINLSGNGNAVYTVSPTLNSCTGTSFLVTVAVDLCQSLSDCNIIVYRTGDGNTPLSDSAQQVSLVEFTSNGSFVQSVAGNFTGSTFLSQSSIATSHGYLNSYNGLTAVPGYTSSYNTDNVASQNTKATYILASNLTGSRILNSSTSPIPFSGNSYRSSIPVSSTTFYCSGTGSSLTTGGVWYYNGSNYIQIYGSTSPTFNIRNIEIYNGQLYISTGAGSARGIYAVGTGLPTTSGQSISLELSNDQTNSSPYGFYISPDGCTAYIAEDGNAGSSTIYGIYKWVKINNVWTYQYNFQCYARGLAVDYSGANPKLYVTTAVSASISATSIIQLTDNGTSFTQNWQQNSGSNYTFSGVDFTSNSTAIVSNPITTQPIASASLCNTQTQTLTVTASGSPTYQWYSNSVNSICGATAISGATSASYTPPATGVDGTVYYFVKVAVNCYSIFTSTITTITTVNTPTPSASNNSPICIGETLTLATPTVSGATYSWTGPNSFSSSTQNPTVTTNATSAVAGTYSVTTTVNGCVSAAGTTIVVINQPPGINAISPP